MHRHLRVIIINITSLKLCSHAVLRNNYHLFATDLIIVGTGMDVQRLPTDFIENCRRKGAGVEIMETVGVQYTCLFHVYN